MIPQEKSAAVTRGLREAFGIADGFTDIEDISRITKGRTSALVFRIVVRSKPYLLRIIVNPHLVIGPERHFSCMKAAAEAGLAPRVRYTSIEDGISITDFVKEVPFPADQAIVLMPALLQKLHALPPFPRVEHRFNTTCMYLLNEGPALEAFIQKMKATNILAKDELDQLFAWHAQVLAVYRHIDSDMVPSHNDLFKPDNILFDGQCVWLVDWEAAFQNDRYADLAVFANLIVESDADEKLYLQEYFGQPPDPYQSARFYLMRQVAHMFYVMAFLLLDPPATPMNPADEVPQLIDFHRRMWTGEVSLSDRETRILYGKVYWQQLLRNMQKPRFEEALRIVAERHPRPYSFLNFYS